MNSALRFLAADTVEIPRLDLDGAGDDLAVDRLGHVGRHVGAGGELPDLRDDVLDPLGIDDGTAFELHARRLTDIAGPLGEQRNDLPVEPVDVVPNLGHRLRLPPAAPTPSPTRFPAWPHRPPALCPNRGSQKETEKR